MPKMKIDEPIRVLLLAKEFRCAQIGLEATHASTSLDIVEAHSREDFLRQIRDWNPNVVVAESDGVRGLPLSDVLDGAAEVSPPVAVVVLGADSQDGREAAFFLDAGAADYLPLSEVGRLPLVLGRLRRDQESITRQRQLEVEVRQAYDALLENQKLMVIGRLAGSIAHEINNPLESITNLLYLLRTEPNLSEKVANYISLAEREMERVIQISKQTLNFYRETPTRVRVRPSELLEEVLVLYSRRIEERRMRVVRQYKTDRDLVVFPGELRQVLSNLVANAIEASPVGGNLTLRLHTARKWSDAGIEGIRIVVADNGCGIPPETRHRLGQLFYTTKGQRGTGLGLWVTQAIVRRYGGEIQLYSSTREGRHGTVFSIFLPTNLRPKSVVKDWDPTDKGGGGYSRRGANLPLEAKARSGGTKTYGTETARSHEFRRRALPRAAS